MQDIPRENCSPSGVDRAQIERMLELLPVERVRQVEDWVNGLVELRSKQTQGVDLGEVR